MRMAHDLAQFARIAFTDVEWIAGNFQASIQCRGAAMARLYDRFCKDRSGATAIEYSILAAGVALAIIVTVQGLGSNVNGMFNSVLTGLK